MSSSTHWLRRVWLARRRLHLVALERSRLLPHLNLATRVTVGGRTFRVPISEGIWLRNNDPEPWFDVVLRRVLAKPEGCFVDVGANLGQTLLKVKAVSPNVDYLGFEPNPRCYCYLKQLIELNNLPSCRTYPLALGQLPAVVELFHTNAVDSAASLVDGFRPPEQYLSKQFASIFRGDDILADVGTIAALKIDVEGAEMDVLLGARQAIERSRPSIICEVLPVYDEQSEIGRFRLARQERIESLLRDLGYSIHRIESTGEITKIATIGVHGDLDRCNYLFLP